MKKTKQKKGLDSLKRIDNRLDFFDFSLTRYLVKHKNRSVLYSKKQGIIQTFFTRDSKLYFTGEELVRIKKGESVFHLARRFDSLISRQFEKTQIYSIGKDDLIYLSVRRRYGSFKTYLSDLFRGSTQGLSLVRMWNLSIVGAVIFGMFTMTVIYRYLGQSVSAKIQDNQDNVQMFQVAQPADGRDFDDINDQIDTEFITHLLEDYNKERERHGLEEEIGDLVKGYPIEKMVPEISKKDRKVAAFLIAIAKKESNWGKRVPILKGRDCYNYWGYRGIRKDMGTGGHTCFSSPKDAVDTVAKRIEFLISNEKLNTPEKMKVWKCGYDCSWDNKKAVQKWVDDVSIYFKKLNKD